MKKKFKRMGSLTVCAALMFSLVLSTAVQAKTNDPRVGRLPAMGWCSWNLYQQDVNEAKIKSQADAMVNTGLSGKGYQYVIIDDGCLAATRKNGYLQPQAQKFPNGFAAMGNYLHDLGLKFGMYNAAGTKTCANLAGSYNFEARDAATFANWGVDYLKYDFCNNPLVSLPVVDLTGDYFTTSFESTILAHMSKEAPVVRKLVIKSVKNNVISEIKTIDINPGNTAVSGGSELDYGYGAQTPCLGMLDANADMTKAGTGTVTFDLNASEMDSQAKYLIDVYCINADKQRLLSIQVNKDTATFPYFYINSDRTVGWNVENAAARTLQNVPLTAGANTVQFSLDRSDCLEAYREDTARSQKAMSDAIDATGRSMIFNICEWGWSQPYTGWGAKVGQSWRTTTDIISTPGIAKWDNEAYGRSIMQIYEKNVILDEDAGPYAYNDPDVLCVGLSGLNMEQNKSHFTLWCMMASPLLLGTDLTSAPQELLDIVGNKSAIAIDQDSLCLQGKRFMQSNDHSIDYIVKPLSDGSVALCMFNKAPSAQSGNVTFKQISDAAAAKVTAKGSEHLSASQTAMFTQNFSAAAGYSVADIWTGSTTHFPANKAISASIPAYGTLTYVLTPDAIS